MSEKAPQVVVHNESDDHYSEFKTVEELGLAGNNELNSPFGGGYRMSGHNSYVDATDGNTHYQERRHTKAANATRVEDEFYQNREQTLPSGDIVKTSVVSDTNGENIHEASRTIKRTNPDGSAEIIKRKVNPQRMGKAAIRLSRIYAERRRAAEQEGRKIA